LHLVAENHPNAPLKRLAQYLSIPIDTAREVYADLQALADINPYGAWPVRDHCLPSPSQLAVSPDRADVIKPDARAYVVDCLRDLADVLPGVSYIQIQAWTEHSHSGTQRRRTYFRFLLSPEQELACIEAATMTFQFRHEVTHDPDHHYHDLNESRRLSWTTQLGITPPDLCVALHLLPMFSLSIPAPGIVLHDPAIARAWWDSTSPPSLA
jgi:hypothetical protein